MPATVSIEIPAEREAIVRRLLAFHEELDQLALSAPDGTVLDACEAAVVSGGRDLQRRMLEDAAARRLETAEKRGRRAASVRAESSRKTADPKPEDSSASSASSR